MKRGLSSIIIFLVLVILLGGVIFYFGVIHKAPTKEAPKKENGFVREFKDMAGNPLNKSDNERNEEGGGGGSGSGSGGGSSGSSSGCGDTKQISYSLNTVYQKNTCLEKEGEVCTKKKIECLTILRDEDSVGGGLFGIELLYKEDESGLIVGNESFSENLNPGEEARLKGEKIISGSSADKRIVCLYHTTKVPQKPDC